MRGVTIMVIVVVFVASKTNCCGRGQTVAHLCTRHGMSQET